MPWTVTYAWDSMDPNPTVVTFEDEREAVEWATEEMLRRVDHIVQHSQYSLSEEDVREIEESESALIRVQRTEAPTMERKRVKKVCETCGSDRVLVDAYAEWDVETQQWELAHTYGYSFCKDCDSETTIVDK